MKILITLYFFLTVSVFAQNSERIPALVSWTDSTGIVKDSSISLIWQKETLSNSLIPVLVSEEKIFYASRDGGILCIDLNGITVWEYETGGIIISQLAAGDGIIAAATTEGDLLTINALTGEVLQVIGLGEQVTSDLTIIDIINQGNKSKGVILGTAAGKLCCYDLYSFELIWENNYAGSSITGKLVYINDRIIFRSRDKFIYCIDGETGTINWKWKNSKVKESPVQNENPNICIAADEKSVYIGDPQNNSLTGIDLLLGTAVWQKKEYRISNSLALSRDRKRIFAPGSPGNFYIISAADGKVIKEIKMESGSGKSYSEPAEWNNKILLGSSSGKIYLIDSQFNWKIILSCSEPVNSVKNIRGSLFAASGNSIILFEIN